MIGFAARRLMELDIEGRTGAAHGERSPDRVERRVAASRRSGKSSEPAGRRGPARILGEDFPGRIRPANPGGATSGRGPGRNSSSKRQ
jgi:hypothetical protein